MSSLPQIDGGWACVLADPPWAFDTYSGKSTTPHRGAHDHYVTTKTADLASSIPLESVVADDAALFMWVVDSHFEEALELGRAWGFSFRTCAFVWMKSRKGGYPHVGMGYWTRKQTEQCWLFTRGRPKRIGKGVAQLIHCPRGAHSAKPDQQYDAIERLVGGPRLELFARSATRPGWTCWGNEVGVRDGALFT